jgi:hypothetical protein
MPAIVLKRQTTLHLPDYLVGKPLHPRVQIRVEPHPRHESRCKHHQPMHTNIGEAADGIEGERQAVRNPAGDLEAREVGAGNRVGP